MYVTKNTSFVRLLFRHFRLEYIFSISGKIYINIQTLKNVYFKQFILTDGRPYPCALNVQWPTSGKGGSDSGYVQRQETSNIESFTFLVLTLLYINDSAYGLIKKKNRES